MVFLALRQLYCLNCIRIRSRSVGLRGSRGLDTHHVLCNVYRYSGDWARIVAGTFAPDDRRGRRTSDRRRPPEPQQESMTASQAGARAGAASSHEAVWARRAVWIFRVAWTVRVELFVFARRYLGARTVPRVWGSPPDGGVQVLDLFQRAGVDPRGQVLPAVIGDDEHDVPLVELAGDSDRDARDRA
jgi:hypothetical protein